MSREELLAAVAQHDGRARPADDTQDEPLSRFEAYRRLALRRARGEMVLLPRQLTGNDRRMHVRETLREDTYRNRIAQHSEGAAAKFDKLAGSLYSFFRGTCLLFYRDMAGEDATMPTVFALGGRTPATSGSCPAPTTSLSSGSTTSTRRTTPRSPGI